MFSIAQDRLADDALLKTYRGSVVYSQLLLHAAKIGVTKTPKAAS